MKTPHLVSALVTMLASGVFALSCSSPPGQLIVVVQTDMAMPKDIDTIKIDVSSAGIPRFSGAYANLGNQNGLRLPATLGLLPPEDETAPATIRVTASQNGVDRVVNEFITTVPRDRIVTLRMPIQFLCDGNPCPSGQTCMAGICVSSTIGSENLPDYIPEEVFGGGNGKDNSGVCLDVAFCFQDAIQVPLEQVNPTDCTVARPSGGGEFNVALATTGPGMCNANGCFVALDADSPVGWTTTESGQIKLPSVICNQGDDPSVIAVALSPTTSKCPQKRISVPTCGPWSSVGGYEELDPAKPVTLAGGQARPVSLVLTTDQVYWVNNGKSTSGQEGKGVKMASRSGGAVTTVYAEDSPRDIAADSTHVYFTVASDTTMSNKLLRAELGAISEDGLWSTKVNNKPEGVAISPAAMNPTVFWTRFVDNKVSNARIDDQVVNELASAADGNLRPYRIVATDDGKAVCWTNEGTFNASDGSVLCWVDGVLTTIATGLNTPRSIALDASRVYWATFGQNGKVVSAPWGVGENPSQTDQALNQSFPNGIAVDQANIYWTTRSDGSVWQCPKTTTDCTPSPLATGQNRPGAIQVTEDTIYWVNEGDLDKATGAIMKRSKP